jgi:hypothetical protein
VLTQRAQFLLPPGSHDDLRENQRRLPPRSMQPVLKQGLQQVLGALEAHQDAARLRAIADFGSEHVAGVRERAAKLRREAREMGRGLDVGVGNDEGDDCFTFTPDPYAVADYVDMEEAARTTSALLTCLEYASD